METLIILVKSAAILSLFYVLYLAVLRRDTFFSANRHYLLSGLIAALVIPFLEFTKTIYLDMPVFTEVPILSNDFIPSSEQIKLEKTTFQMDWWYVMLIIYVAGVLIMLTRLGVQLYSLQRLLKKHLSVKKGDYSFVAISDDIAPFSFFKTICYNPELHTEAELQMILEHEKVHASQYHTFDVLLTQVVLAFQWLNPLAWFYKQSLEQNLEFIADNGAIQTVPSTKAYQHTVVKVSSTALRPALTNQFYHSLIKKRIVMLNKEASRRRNLWKLGLILPLLGIFMYSFNVKEIYEYKEVVPVEEGELLAFAKADEKTNTEKTYTLKSEMTDEQIDELIRAIEKEAEDLSIRFTERKRLPSGKLSHVTVTTKYPGQDRFYKHMTFKNAQGKPIHNLSLQVVNGNSLQLSDFLLGFVHTISKDGIDTKYKKSPSTKAPLKNSFPEIGENPIHLINGNIVRASKLKNKVVAVDGHVSLLGKTEAIENYGEKAKDGAFVYHGKATVQSENQVSQSKSQGDNQTIFMPSVKIVNESDTTIQDTKAIDETISQQFVKEEVTKVAQNRTSTQDDTYKFVITKNTTVEELKALKQKLKDDHNATLKYSDVNFNEQGEIISIKLKFKDGYGNSSNYHTSSQTAIRDIYIYREADGRNGIGNYVSSVELEEEMEKRLFKRRERMEARQGAMEERRQELQEKREVRREEMQKRREGMREEMKLRSEGARQEMRERRREMEKHKKEIFEKIKAQERRKSLFSDDSALDEIPRPQSATVPLYILDEKEVKYEDIKTLLDPNKIKSVSVLKGKSALTLYGSKGKNGVIVIESKE